MLLSAGKIMKEVLYCIQAVSMPISIFTMCCHGVTLLFLTLDQVVLTQNLDSTQSLNCMITYHPPPHCYWEGREGGSS